MLSLLHCGTTKKKKRQMPHFPNIIFKQNWTLKAMGNIHPTRARRFYFRKILVRRSPFQNTPKHIMTTSQNTSVARAYKSQTKTPDFLITEWNRRAKWEIIDLELTQELSEIKKTKRNKPPQKKSASHPCEFSDVEVRRSVKIVLLIRK